MNDYAEIDALSIDIIPNDISQNIKLFGDSGEEVMFDQFLPKK